MKSARNMMKFIQNCLTGNNQNRRGGGLRRNRITGAEAMEQRLLLTADLDNVLFTPIVLENLQQNTPVESYFVRFDTNQSADQLQQVTEAASVTESAFVTNGFTFEFEEGMNIQDAADLFSSLADFDYLHPNIQQTPQVRAVPNDPLYDTQWHLNNTGQGGGLAGADINVESVWDNYTGQGVTIGVIDDGLEVAHEDIAPNANTTIDFDYRDGDNDPSPGAGDFHGTAVGGAASAKGNNGIGVSGSAWDAELVGLRLIGGFTTDATEAQALSHELNTIDVYNNSWGPADDGRIHFIGPQALAALEQTATTGRNGLGNIHTWAAGNGGDFTNDDVNYDPYASSRFTIAVGALSNSGVRAQYSDTGAALFLVAPSGDSNGSGTLDLITTDITGAAGYDATNYTSSFNGTSASTPVVSGVIALMLEANPNLTYRDVSNILARTSVRVDPGNADWVQNGDDIWVNHEYGFGNIDAAAAVDAALNNQLLGEEESFSTGIINVNQAIPDFGSGSVTQAVTVSSADAIDALEYVEVSFTAAHARIGDLEIVLTSPSGTESILAETRTDNTNGYTNFLFSSVRNWGESSAGEWTVSVTDGTAGSQGTLTSFEINFYGSGSQFVSITESGGNTRVSDFGQSDTFEVVLPAQPASDVVLTVTSADLSEVTVLPQTLTFTTTNWDVPQVVSVTGVSDLQPDGTQTTNVVISDGVETATVAVTSIDDDGTVPGKPVITGPDQFAPSNTPIFTWTPGIRSASFTLTVIDLQTGAMVQQASNIAASEFAFASPFPDGLYQATVQAANTIGQAGEASDPWIFNIGDPIIPGQPRITSPITGSVINNNQPTIQWTSQPGAFEYELYFLTNGQVTRFRTPGVNVGNDQLAFATVTPFDEGVTSVWVRAFNFFGTAGEWSVPVNFTVDAFGLPTIPRLTAPLLSVTSNAFPTFEWTSGGPNASTYELWVAELRDGTGTPQTPAIYDRVIHLTDASELNYRHFNALNEKTHRAWVRSFNVAGEASRWSSFVEFSVSVPTPEAPVVTPIVNTQDTTPRITWDPGAAVTPGTTYRLWINNLSTGVNRVVDVRGLESTSYTPVDALEQGRLAVWVQATNSTGETGPWSDRVIVNIDILPPPVTTMTGPVAALNAESSVVLSEFPQFSWLPSFNAVRYELWVNHDDSGTSRIINEKDVQGLSFTPTLALPQGNFSAWVRGINVANEVGEWSARFRFFLDVPTPSRPEVIAPTPNAVGVVIDPTPTIVWQVSVPGNTYDLQLIDAVTDDFVINTTGLVGLSYTVPTELQEREYRVRVRSVNTIGETSEWSEFLTFRVDEPNATTPVALGPTGTIRQNDLTFQWRHSPDSIRYEILVRDLRDQSNIVLQAESFDIDNSNNVASFNHNLANGTYRFWIRAFNTQNTASGWSNSLSFIVDRPLAMLEDSPLDGDLLLTSLDMRRDLTEQPVVIQHEQQPTVVPATEETEAEVSEYGSSDADIEFVMAEFADPANFAAIVIEQAKS